MYKALHRYSSDDRMSDLIAANYQFIQVMSRFGIKVGFGDKTIAEVCADAGVDCKTFLAVINFVIEGYTLNIEISSLSLKALLQYLSQSHIYFLEYCLPSIRRKLLDGIRLQTSDVSFLILKFFDEYTDEVRTHMEHEEKHVFAYVLALTEGKIPEGFQITTYSEHHEQVSDKLKELKSIILKYCPQSADINLLNAALYDIYRCEEELENHCLVEDRILVPAILHIEKKIRENGEK